MKKHFLLNLSVWLGAVLWNILFWGENQGLNTLLFTLALLAALFTLHPDSRRNRSVRYLSGGLLFAAGLVVWHHSDFAIVIYWLTFFGLAGMVQQREIKFLFFGFLLALLKFFSVPKKIFSGIFRPQGVRVPWEPVFRYGKLVIFPSVVVFLFFQLYATANLKFAEITRSIFSGFTDWLTRDFDFGRMLFFTLGLFLTGMLLYPTGISFFGKTEIRYPNTLVRRRKRVFDFFGLPGFLALKNEYRSAVILLTVLNLLLAAVNLLDLRYVWAGTEMTSPQELSIYVHEGTYVLIFSVLCAAAILLWHFRGNLNFYPKNLRLRRLAFLWIAQNALLAFSVGVRNWRYVFEYGLAYKRIGVFIFLLLLLAGLYFLFLKISEKRSLFYLLRRQSWTVWIVLLAAATINWDIAITKFNLSGIPNTEQLDLRFLAYNLSDKNLYLLAEREDKLKQRYGANTYDYAGMLAYKKEAYRYRTAGTTWLSWNAADARNRAWAEE